MLCQNVNFFGIVVVFNYLVNFVLGVLYVYILVEYYVEVMVMGLVVGVGEYQVIEVGYVYKGFWIGVQCCVEVGYFYQFMGNQCCMCIGVEVDVI